MRMFLDLLYSLALAFWVGGISIFTFIITPIIFKSHGRDMAGTIVGHIFPYYFIYILTLSGAALFLFLLTSAQYGRAISLVSVALLATAVVISILHIAYFLPSIEELKTAIGSFEHTPRDHPLRVQFGKLHAFSSVLNLFMLLEGVALLVIRHYTRH